MSIVCFATSKKNNGDEKRETHTVNIIILYVHVIFVCKHDAAIVVNENREENIYIYICLYALVSDLAGAL